MKHRRPPKPFNAFDTVMLILITTFAMMCIFASLATVAGWRP